MRVGFGSDVGAGLNQGCHQLQPALALALPAAAALILFGVSRHLDGSLLYLFTQPSLPVPRAQITQGALRVPESFGALGAFLWAGAGEHERRAPPRVSAVWIAVQDFGLDDVCAAQHGCLVQGQKVRSHIAQKCDVMLFGLKTTAFDFLFLSACVKL